MAAGHLAIGTPIMDMAIIFMMNLPQPISRTIFYLEQAVAQIKSILGKDANYNSKKIIEIFNGKHNAFLEIVALNAAAGLVISEKENNLKKAYYKTKSYLLSGNVIKKINQLTK